MSDSIEKDLRIWLAEQLGMNSEKDPVFDKLWRMLENEQHIEFAVQEVAMGEEDEGDGKRRLRANANLLVDYAESEAGSLRHRRRRKKAPRSSSSKRKPRRSSSSDYKAVRVRTKVLREYLAFRGSLHPLVRQYREEVLGGETLTPQLAHSLVGSDAAKRFTLSRFQNEGIPVIGHTAHFHMHDTIFKKMRTERFIEYEYVSVDPPGRLLRTHLPVSVAFDDLEYLWFPSDNVQPTSNAGYRYVRGDEEYYPTPVYPNSVLDILLRVSRKLVEEYGRCWNQAQAAWFVLTGEALAPSAIMAEYRDYSSEHLTHGTITLTVKPWVPTKMVVDLYEYLRGEMLGRKPRAPEERNLAVLEFFIRQSVERLLAEGGRDNETEQHSWQELMERWNRENPDHSYTFESKFRRDFRRGASVVLWPYDPEELLFPMKMSIP